MTSMSSTAARRSNATRTSATVWPGLPVAIAETAFLTLKYSMYAGAILSPPIATMTTMMPAINRPIRVMPRWFLMVGHLSVKFADATQVVEIEPDEERLAHDILVRDESPDAAVGGIVAVVTHHEIVPRRHGAGHAFGIVVAILAERERPRERDRRRRVGLLEDRVVDPVQGLLVLGRV